MDGVVAGLAQRVLRWIQVTGGCSSREPSARAGVIDAPFICHDGMGEGSVARVRVLAMMWMAASFLGIVAAGLPQGSRVDRLGELVLALLGGVTGICLLAVCQRVPAWAVHGLLVGGVACVSAAVYLANGSREAVAAGYMYLWIVSFAGYFFRPLVASMHFLVVAAAFCSVLA